MDSINFNYFLESSGKSYSVYAVQDPLQAPGAPVSYCFVVQTVNEKNIWNCALLVGNYAGIPVFHQAGFDDSVPSYCNWYEALTKLTHHFIP